MFPPNVIRAMALVCIASTFLVVVPWFVQIARHARRSVGFVITSLLLACAKLMVMVPIIMLWGTGQLSSSLELWAISVPFFIDFALMFRSVRFFRPENPLPPGV